MSLKYLEELIRKDIEQMTMSPPPPESASQVRPMSSAYEARLRQEHANETLSHKLLIELWRKWQHGLKEASPVSSSLTVIEVPETPIYAPVKRHRKRRIQKKWTKRFGMKIVGYERPLGDQVLLFNNGVAFCHPHVRRMMEWQTPIEMKRASGDLWRPNGES